MKIRTLLIAATAFAGSLSFNTISHAGSNPFIAETMVFGGNFCPRGWARMDGQLLSISSNTALFSLLGTTYGGDGRTTFGLPDVRGRSIIGDGSGAGLSTFRIGQRGGQETTTLTEPNMPSHTHRVAVATNRGRANSTDPAGNVFGTADSDTYVSGGNARGNFMSEDTIQLNSAGSGTAFENRDPYIAMTNCIALIGVFPSRS